MSSILCDALCFSHSVSWEQRERFSFPPPATLLCTASIFSALAPRAGTFIDVTPPLLALLRRSPFFCFTQHFVLFNATDEHVCQVIRECVAIKSLNVAASNTITGSFVKDAILSSDGGGFITRTLEDLDTSFDREQGVPLVPLVAPSSSVMTPTFIRNCAGRLWWCPGAGVCNFPRESESQLLQSSLEALEGTKHELWEPALMLVATIVARQNILPIEDEPPLIDERIVRRCVGIVEELIDADEHVGLLAVEVMTRLLEHCPDLVVPLLLRESDAMRGVLMLCDRFIERLKRGERVAGFSSPDTRGLPLSVLLAAVRAVATAAPACDLLEVLSYRERGCENQRVRTLLDVVVAYMACPTKVSEVGRRPRRASERREDTRQHRVVLVADPVHGREIYDEVDDVLSLLAVAWPRPFNIDGSAAQQQLLGLVALRVQDAFAFCDRFVQVDPAAAIQGGNAAMAEKANQALQAVLKLIEPALYLVSKGGEDEWDLYHEVNAQIPHTARELDRVGSFNSLLSIRRSHGGGTSAAVQSFTDIILLVLRARLHYEYAVRPRARLYGEGDEILRMVERSAEGAHKMVWFLYTVLDDCQRLLGEASESDDDDDDDDDSDEENVDDDEEVEDDDAAPNGGADGGREYNHNEQPASGDGVDRRRQRPDDENLDQQQQQQLDTVSSEVRDALEAITAILRLPDVLPALLSIQRISDAAHPCDQLLKCAVKRGCVSADELDALRAATAARFAQRPKDKW